MTTVVTGNCGGSADSLKEFFTKVDATAPPSTWPPSSATPNTVRRVMGLAQPKATPEEQARMEAWWNKGMRDGGWD